MGLHRIGADPDDFCSRLLEHFVAVSKGTRFGCAGRRVILPIEVQHNRALPAKISETYWSACLVRERKIWGQVAYLDVALRLLCLIVMLDHCVSSFSDRSIHFLSLLVISS